MDKLTFEELNNITSKVREEKKLKNIERINLGRKDAIETIVKDYEKKMLDSSSKGFDKTILYSFEWVSDPKAVSDSKGVKTVFGENVRLLDLITKGRDEFIKELNNYFNKTDENNFHCGFYRKKREGEIPDIWNIYVSWAPPSQSTDNFHMNNYGRPTVNNYENSNMNTYTKPPVNNYDNSYTRPPVNNHETSYTRPPANNSGGRGRFQGRGFGGRMNSRGEPPHIQRIPTEYSNDLTDKDKDKVVPKGFAPPRINRKSPI